MKTYTSFYFKKLVCFALKLIKLESKHNSYSNRTVGLRILISIYIFASEWLPFQSVFTKRKVMASKLQVTPTKLQVTSTKLQVTPTKLQVTLTKLQVTPTKLQVTRSKFTSLTAETNRDLTIYRAAARRQRLKTMSKLKRNE